MLHRFDQWLGTTDPGIVFLLAIVSLICCQARILAATGQLVARQRWFAAAHLIVAFGQLIAGFWFLIVWIGRVF